MSTARADASLLARRSALCSLGARRRRLGRRAELRALRRSSAPAFSARAVPVPLEPHRPRGRDDLAERRAQAGRRRPRADRRRRARGRPGPGGAAARRIHRPGARPGARHARPAGLRPARHRQPRTRSAAARSSSFGGGSASQVFERCALRSARPAAATRPRNRSKTSRRCARPRATKSSSCTAPPTAPRSPLEYAERYPQHVEALVLDSVVPAERAGTVRDPHLPGDRPGARRAVLERRLRRDHHQSRGRHRDA